MRGLMVTRMLGCCLALLALHSLGGCGGGSHGEVDLGPSMSPAGNGENGPLPPRELSVEEVLRELELKQAPPQLDAALFDQLKAELAAVLRERGVSKIICAPPAAEASATVLTFDQEAGTLSWRFYSQGDYDQNGEVNISDLTPLGLHFGEVGPFDPVTALSVIDGDENGELNIADITPMGLNFGAELSGYKLYRSASLADYPSSATADNGPGAVEEATLALDDAGGDPRIDRLLFELPLAAPVPNSYYWVRPVDAAGTPGIASNPIQAPAFTGLLFEQVDYNLTGVTITDSPFGNVQVSYIGTAEPQYFNLVVDGRWVIENIPVLPYNGVGEAHTVWMAFNLGVAAGTEVAELTVAASLTDDVIDTPPSLTYTVPVTSRSVKMSPGRGIGGPTRQVSENGDGPADEDGGKVVDHAEHGGSFPNQDCGDGQCAAAGVSNSLEYLADAYDIPIGDNADPPGSRPIDIGTVDGVMGATARAGSGWANVKAKWLRDNDYNIETNGIPPKDDQDHEATADECEAAMDALKRGADVEMNGESHTAALVGMAKLDNGKYVMYVAHDTDQGPAPDHTGGTCVEKVVYDPNSALPEAQDGWNFYGGMINGFVVEEYPLLVDSWPWMNFEQLFFVMDDTPTEKSGTGRSHTIFETPEEQSYYNLSFNGEWLIRNMPVPMFTEAGGFAEVAIPFDLGVPDGTDLDFNYYDFSVDTVLATEAPGGAILDVVGNGTYVLTSGDDGASLSYLGPPPLDLWWFPGEVADSAFHDLEDIENQDCGEGECAPTAVSNSLKMLKNMHADEMSGLSDDPGSDSDDTDIGTLKPATGWDAGPPPGSPGIPVGGDFDDPGAWWNLKDSWMDARGNYPIATETITDQADFGDVLEAIRDGKDVELRVPGHVVMVVGAVKLDNGDYLLWVAHDTEQGENGGTTIEPVYYDASANTFRGAAWINGRQFGNGQCLFVVESAYAITIEQTDWDLEGLLTADSPWGALEFTHQSAGSVQFLNLSVGGEWAVQNLPIPAFVSVGSEQAITTRFSLGVAQGTALSTAGFGYSLGPTALGEPPIEVEISSVESGIFEMNSGEPEHGILYEPPPEDPIMWSIAPITDVAVHPGEAVVNQDCEKGECAPTAVSNSLKTLKNMHEVEMGELSDDPESSTDETDIDTMKPVTGWDAGPPPGAPGIPLGGDYAAPGAWWNQKSEWMTNNSDYPISTELITNPANIGDIMDALKNGEDVELRVPGHVVMVVGAVQYANGDYVLYVAHDTAQGKDGGTTVEPIYYNAGTGKFSGPPWADGYQLGNGQALFVVESVDIFSLPSTLDYLGEYVLGDGTEGDPIWALNGTTLPFSVTHPILGDVTEDPGTMFTTVPPGAGVFVGGELQLDPTFGGPLTVSATYYDVPTIPPESFFDVYLRKPDSIYAWPDADLVPEGEAVLITVWCNDTLAPFLRMDGVRVTMEDGNFYVPMSFNAGEPGGAPDELDGVWAMVNPPGGLFLPADGSYVPVPLGGGRIGYDFSIDHLGGIEYPGATGALFNFGLQINTDVSLSFQRLDAMLIPRTYYSDGMLMQYNWASDENVGAPTIKVVPAT